MTGAFAIALYVLILLLVILMHEAGHFLTAKAFKIKVEEFFLGFGPRVWSFRRGETEYGIKALPLGGYVRIAGMNPFQETAPEDLPRSYGAKPLWQRAIVIATGPVTHFLLAILVFAVYFAAVGVPRYRPLVQQVEPRLEGRVSPAAAAGLEPGDEIVGVLGRPVRSIEDFVQQVGSHVGEPLRVEVERNERRLVLEASPVMSGPPGERHGRLGVVLGTGNVIARDRTNPFSALARGTAETGAIMKAVVLRLGDVFGPSGIRRIGRLLLGLEDRQVDDVTSVVGGARLSAQAAEAGLYEFFFGLFALFNVFVGILNLLPLPPLDGGHLAVLAVEGITRRRVDPRRLLPLTAVVGAFMVLLMVSLVYLDIVSPIPSPFR